MIQNKTAADRQVSGNLTGEDIKMKVGDMSHLMNVVTDLYSDRELAVIREYSTNAVDAHIEAGVQAPIEVTTPSALSPFLTIQDFGCGLNIEDIREIYSQYGISTKRNTNGQTGMLGLGCKSALSYTDSFTVTSVKDGVRIQVVVSRNSNGASMKVVDTSNTSDPNGTIVTVPARANSQFDRKAKDFFSYWRKGTVKLNGVEPEFMPGVKWVSDSICIKETQGYSHDCRIVMGGVPYPAPDLKSPLGYGKSIVAFVGIGEVDFAPSREGLMDTETTSATIKNVETAFANSLKASVKKDVASAGSHREAVERKLEWRSSLPHQLMPADLTYKGLAVPDSQRYPEGTIHAGLHGRKMNSHMVLDNHDRTLPIQTAMKCLYVYGFDYASFTATVKKKLDMYCQENDIERGGYILLTGDMSTMDTKWLGAIPTIDWPTVKALKLPRNVRSTVSGRIPGSYDIWENGDPSDDTPADDIDTSHEIFWAIGSHWAGQTKAKWLAKKFPKGCTLVMMRDGRQDKFQRLFPTARKAEKFLKDEYEAWVKGLDPKLVQAWANQEHRVFDLLDKYDVTKIIDPDIKALVAVKQIDTSNLAEQISEWSSLGFYYTPPGTTIQDPFYKYTLLPDSYYLRRGRQDMEHLYRYMNNEYRHMTAAGRS